MKLSRDAYYIAVIFILIALCGQFYYSYRYQPTHQVQVFYNKEESLNRKIISEIQRADKFVYFAIYTFTRQDIKDALLAAKYRGLEVKGITDKTQVGKIEQQAKIIKDLEKAGIPIETQDHDAIMHLKALVTDKSYVSGSYNWTASATNSNDEILEIGRDENIRAQYQNTLERILGKYAHP